MAISMEYVRLDSVQTLDGNAKLHSLQELARGIKRFGFIAPLIKDDRTDVLTAGHGRLEVLAGLYAENPKDPPLYIMVDDADGMWMVPVLCGVEFTSDAELRAYALADNRIPELGGWHDHLLMEMMDEVRRLTSAELEGLGLEDLGRNYAAMEPIGEDDLDPSTWRYLWVEVADPDQFEACRTAVLEWASSHESAALITVD